MPIHRELNQRFFQEWTPEMAYVLGFFAADGNMIKNRRGAHFVAFYSNDQELLVGIREALRSNHKIGVLNRLPPENIAYQLQLGSKQLFSDLLALGLTPNKSLTLVLPEVPKDHFPHFIRGYFDGDGCVYFKQHFAKDRQKLRWSFTARFTSGSRNFLVALHSKLRSYGLKGGFIVDKNRGFELIFSQHDSLALAALMYDTIPCSNLYLKRKYNLFQKAKFTLRGV